MTLIKCPDCEKNVSEVRGKCPLCGCRLVKRANVGKVILNIFLILLICVSAFIAVVAFTLGNTLIGSVASVVVIISLIRLFVK